MIWDKKGFIYKADGRYTWATSHAMVPTPEISGRNEIRIYLNFCDNSGIGRVGYIDVLLKNPSVITNISSKPIIDIGKEGTFDENGVLATSIVKLPDGRRFLYYVGFELGVKIRYRLLTGLAISEDGGKSFFKFRRTPILERSDKELYFRCGPFVLFDDNKFKLWYVAGSSWVVVDGKAKPSYLIKYSESDDGINWPSEGKVCIDIAGDDEYGCGRPYVVKNKNKFQMFYSIRSKDSGYKLGYAESDDGILWSRRDKDVGINVSSSGWDSQMVCYSAVLDIGNSRYLFYNGNNFGESGVGYAILRNPLR